MHGREVVRELETPQRKTLGARAVEDLRLVQAFVVKHAFTSRLSSRCPVRRRCCVSCNGLLPELVHPSKILLSLKLGLLHLCLKLSPFGVARLNPYPHFVHEALHLLQGVALHLQLRNHLCCARSGGCNSPRWRSR